jgi:AcrR family transcriptional regulator
MSVSSSRRHSNTGPQGGGTPASRSGERAGRRPQRKRQKEGRVDILRAAAALLATHGYHGMTMRDLARSTKMSLANLYNYFGSKEDLVFALQIRALETLVASAREATLDAGDGEARLHAFILGHVRYVATHTDVMRVLIEEAGELPPARRRAVREIKERYFTLGREIVASVVKHGRSRSADEARDAGALDRATYSIFGMLNWVYAWYDPARHGGPQEVARTIHGIAMSGLVARHPSRSSQSATERLVSRVRLRSPIHDPAEGAS